MSLSALQKKTIAGATKTVLPVNMVAKQTASISRTVLEDTPDVMPVVSAPNPASGAATFAPTKGCGTPSGITSAYASGKIRQIWFTLRSNETSAFTATFRREEFAHSSGDTNMSFLVENSQAATNSLLQLLQHSAIVFDRVALISNNAKTNELLSQPIRIYGVYPMNGGNRIYIDEITPFSEQSQYDQNENRLVFSKIWVLDSLTDFQMNVPANTGGSRNISFDFICGVRDIVPLWALGQYLENLNKTI